MAKRFRGLLPLYVGVVDAALMFWDIHNQRVILSVGMGWDMGAPLWPFQTPDTLLFALNFPAYIVAVPLGRLLRLYVPWHYFVLFPAMIVWWWLAGYALDCGLFKNERLRWPSWSLAVIFTLAFTVVGAIVLHDSFVWWNQYCRRVFTLQNIITLRASTPGLWSIFFAALAAVLAKRRSPLGDR